jgi:hypothetical protein
MTLNTDPGASVGLRHSPNAGHEAIMHPSFTDGETDYPTRLGIVRAEMILDLTNALGDEREARALATKFLDEFLAATAIKLDGEELRKLAAKATQITSGNDPTSVRLPDPE